MRNRYSLFYAAAGSLGLIALCWFVLVRVTPSSVDPTYSRSNARESRSGTFKQPSGNRSTLAGSRTPSAANRRIPGAIDAQIYVDFVPPKGKYSESIGKLRMGARGGHVEDAYALSRLLLDCYFAQKGVMSSLGSNEPDRCDGVKVESAKEAIDWLTLSADHGYDPAKILYPSLVSQVLTPTDMIKDPAMVQDYKDRSISYLTSVAGEGSEGAMLALSKAYADGVLANKNLEMAYAYRYAADMINSVDATDDPKDVYGGNLTDEQISNARKIAGQIFTKCCG